MSIATKIFQSLRARGLNLPDPKQAPQEFGSPTVIPARPFGKRTGEASDTCKAVLAELSEPCGKAARPRMPDPDSAEKKRADREALWYRYGWHEMKRLVPFMELNGCNKEVIAHARQVLADMTEAAHKKYPELRRPLDI